ncbi:MAG: SpoIID/LytB domain-containing protein [Cyanobacteria bacterium RU_5_0]|nr:SpoIID/LytB domain-containing protein [Cyanobacteria bacterium RU_5_0]
MITGWRSFKKWLNQRLWLGLLLLGLFSLSAVLLLGHLRSHLTASPTLPSAPPSIATPSPIVAPSSPTAPLTPSKQVGGVTQSPDTEPSVTEEEQAAQERAKAELLASRASIDSVVDMQVAIALAKSEVTVAVSSDSRLLNETGEAIQTLTPGAAYIAQADGASILFDGASMGQFLWVEPPIDGVFQLGNRTYRGRLLLACAEGKLWAVNYVSMKNYLNSVVPSEVSPSWNMEALKAQTVAARSYALTYYFHPVNSLYHLGDDEYFQVYSGVATEADRTREAIDATAGEFVSYQGGIVESLYAASDAIVAEAFQGKGMSQLGALSLAEQGYPYDRILSNYYPGTSIGKIVQDF